jgi:hypothetical protein
MALAFQGVSRSQDQLAKQLHTRPLLGTPARNVQRLASHSIDVTHAESTFEQLQEWLASGIPIIAFIEAGELPYWRGKFFKHAVVIIGLEAQLIWLLDPDVDSTPIAVHADEFMLAWGGMDYLYAAVVVHH